LTTTEHVVTCEGQHAAMPPVTAAPPARHEHEHDDRHDRGLLFDLETMRSRVLASLPAPPQLGRRGALKLLGGAGLGLLVAACGGGNGSSSSASSSSSSSTTAAAAAAAAAGGPPDGGGGPPDGGGMGGGQPTDGSIPEETGGPFPGDGSNGPNVLTESGVVRQDITTSFGDLSGTAEGVPLTIEMALFDTATGEPLQGAAVYAWHCTREGGYSLYSEGVEDQNFLRGVQEVGSEGTVTFTSIFPAAYDGRWPHVHFEVFSSLDDATSAGSRLVTSQLALPEDACNDVYATEGYEASVQNLARTSLDGDMVFSDGSDSQLAEVTGDVDSGMTASLTFNVTT
jgi:protocatechuate 3,4-dioxygenase beta subunit